jgi:hypothetical protein
MQLDLTEEETAALIIADMPLAYLPGNALGVRVRVAGRIKSPL